VGVREAELTKATLEEVFAELTKAELAAPEGNEEDN
jgi:hypothetical protein